MKRAPLPVVVAFHPETLRIELVDDNGRVLVELDAGAAAELARQLTDAARLLAYHEARP